MRKKLMVGLSLLMTVAMLTGCGSKPAETATTEEPKTETPAVAETAGEAKTGLGIITTIDKSKNAEADKNGQVQTYSMIAAVIVDADGKLAKIAVDGMQTKIDFDAEGKIVTDLATVFESKVALGEAYGMKKNSGIGKEWSEQIAAFIEYAEGKTIDELKGIALNEEGRPTGDDLKASVTVHVDDVIDVIEKAVQNAQNLGASSTDTLGLAMDTTIAKSKDAAADADGLAQAYTNIVAATFDADGKVTSAIVDGVQANVNFNNKGEVTTDLATLPPSKVEIGDDYGMKKNSGIGKECYEQVKAFAEYVVGKTVAEVKAIELDGEGRPSSDDLKSSVTIHVNDQVRLLEKAATTAR